VEEAGRERLGARSVRPGGRVGEQRGREQLAPRLVEVEAGAAEVAEGLAERGAGDDAARREHADAHDRVGGGGEAAPAGGRGGVRRA